jgi:hypothetical protein
MRDGKDASVSLCHRSTISVIAFDNARCRALMFSINSGAKYTPVVGIFWSSSCGHSALIAVNSLRRSRRSLSSSVSVPGATDLLGTGRPVRMLLVIETGSKGRIARVLVMAFRFLRSKAQAQISHSIAVRLCARFCEAATKWPATPRQTSWLASGRYIGVYNEYTRDKLIHFFYWSILAITATEMCRMG